MSVWRSINKQKDIPFIVVQKHEALRYKSDKICARFICWKLCNTMINIKDDPKREQDTQCLWIGRFSIIDMLFLPKLIYRFSTSSFKILTDFFCVSNLILKFLWKSTGLSIAQTVLKTNSVQRFTLLDFKKLP